MNRLSGLSNKSICFRQVRYSLCGLLQQQSSWLLDVHLQMAQGWCYLELFRRSGPGCASCRCKTPMYVVCFYCCLGQTQLSIPPSCIELWLDPSYKRIKRRCPSGHHFRTQCHGKQSWSLLSWNRQMLVRTAQARGLSLFTDRQQLGLLGKHITL